MSLSLSFHTNFVQMAQKGRTYWAPRASWEDVAQNLLKDSAQGEPLIFSLTDLELEVSRSLTPSLTLVFPDGLEDWLSLQAGSLSDQREGLTSLLAASHCVPRSKWKPSNSEATLVFSHLSEPGLIVNSPQESLVQEIFLEGGADEILTWTSAIAQIFLKEKLKKETVRFLEKNKNHLVFTASADGLREGIQSPLLGTPTALSGFLEEQCTSYDNHLFLGWENFFFSYRDSLGGWHSHALGLQPFHSFKIDLHHKILPEPQGKLFLPMCQSLSLRPTLMDVFGQFLPLPQVAPEMNPQRLKDGFMTFFNLKWSGTSTKFLLESILEEIFWSVESQRTSEQCLVEGPLAPLFVESTPTITNEQFELGSIDLQEVHFLSMIPKAILHGAPS